MFSQNSQLAQFLGRLGVIRQPRPCFLVAMMRKATIRMTNLRESSTLRGTSKCTLGPVETILQGRMSRGSADLLKEVAASTAAVR